MTERQFSAASDEPATSLLKARTVSLEPRLYSVSKKDKKPILSWMLRALAASGCRVIYSSSPDKAPFRITFETRLGERMGIMAYAFLANSRLTKNRPADEHRFQIKYGPETEEEHSIWQDPYGLYTTVMLGINLEQNFFVGIDPVLHSPTKFFIMLGFKQREVDQILADGWHFWERDRRQGLEGPVETLVGGLPSSFLHYIRFEREALGEDQGHRFQLASRGDFPIDKLEAASAVGAAVAIPAADHLHALAKEFELTEQQILGLISGRRRLKTAVRGAVAEIHLEEALRKVPGITDLNSLDRDAGGDISLRYYGSRPILIECKNVRGVRTAAGLAQVDFQRTRASKVDPCSRYYSAADFDVVAACLHAVTNRWEFNYALTSELSPHPTCEGKLASNVRLTPQTWREDVSMVLRKIAES